MATLFLVSTPIGNLGDLTQRAAQVLGSVSRILAEDTRRTRILLEHLELATPLVSLHAHNEASRVETVLAWLDAGEDLALVSDAGTPMVSDPGSRIVAAAAEGGYDVVPVPGPSAVLAALVASGLPGDRFSFLGFLPRKGPVRSDLLDRIASSEETTVLFESPERVRPLIQALLEVCGPERRAVLARELTKMHEEMLRGTLAELQDRLLGRKLRGEVTVVVAGSTRPFALDGMDEAVARALVAALVAEGMSPSRIAREVARKLKIPRNAAYRLTQDLIDSGQEGVVPE